MHISFFQLTVMMIMLLGLNNNCTSSKTSSSSLNTQHDRTVVTSATPLAKPIDNKWQPAIFKGLRVGRDVRSEAIKVLGKPDSSVVSDQNDLPLNSELSEAETLDTYKNTDFYGETTIISSRKNNIILEVMVQPKNLSVDEAIQIFGKDYQKTRYDFLECPGDAGSSFIYESKKGIFEYVEFRSKGIALKADESGRRVEDIRFVSQPIGVSFRKCPE